MLTSAEILQLFNSRLAALEFSRRPATLYAPIKYVLSMGGKRIRPSLMLMAYNLYKDKPEDICRQAIALEMYHNYTLLHDDLMDKADMRRGHETVHRKWDENTAILSGDQMYIMAFGMMSDCQSEMLKPVMQLFTETALEIGEGQQYDMDFEKRTDVTVDEYIEMIRLKTSVLLACALKIGAVLGGASEQDAENLYKFGEQMGLAFQLQDDWLDVYGDPKVFGKAIGGDILCNKKTFMLINAANRADEEQRRELMKWITAEQFDPKEKIAAVTSLYNKLGIDQLAEAEIKRYFDLSLSYLDKVSVAEDRKQVLRSYALAMMGRQS